MIGIAQDKRGIDSFEMLGRKCFNCSLRPHGREDGRNKVAVWRGEYPCAGAVGPGCDFEFKHAEDCKREPEDFAPANTLCKNLRVPEKTNFVLNNLIISVPS